MQAPPPDEALPEGRLYAQVETLSTLQDYPPRQYCVRLVGVSPKSFDTNAFNEEAGCETYILDVSFRDAEIHGFIRDYSHRAYLSDLGFLSRHFGIDTKFWGEKIVSSWLQIDYAISKERTGSYVYSAFREGDSPTYLKILNLQIIKGPTVKAAPVVPNALVFEPDSAGDQTSLTAFHVGQGMCSILAGNSVGYLLDAGAGTPVNRQVYRSCCHPSGVAFQNDLRSAVAPLSKLTAILSHPDSDHWRLLEWDPQLLAKVDRVFLPNGTPALAMASPVVKSKVWGMSDTSITLSPTNGIEIFRSQRNTAPLTRNNDALVAKVYVGKKQALIAGDYVYKDMALDDSALLAALTTMSFDALVVPHHGDAASAQSIPPPKYRRKSLAFFSAGNHQGYKHPTTVSMDTHVAKGYVKIENRFCADILAQKLL